MDYGTFLFTNIASVTVFTVWICVLAWYNRRVTGMLWFAGAQIVGLAKLVLQGLEGKIPPFPVTASELYLVSILLQWMGLRWFVVRKPMRRPWPWIVLGGLLAAYTIAFLAQISYAANIINLPFLAICGLSAWMLWKNARAPFTAVANVSAGIAALQMGVATYRVVLSNLHYGHHGDNLKAHTDPHWVNSLAAAAFLAACMAMCELWFLVAELQSKLAEQARTDPLTGILNRRSMEEAAQRETTRSIRYGRALSMIVVDIDNFKRLNDTCGHGTGDHALQALVSRAKVALRREDLFARTGGDEFSILLPDTTGAAAFVSAERIRRIVEEIELPSETGPIKFTVCAGVAQLYPARGCEEMVRQADAAMYEAKRRGRNLVYAFPQPGEDPAKTASGVSVDGRDFLPSP
jgi:diguanylate cyclase (GGDEF)-like protein